MGSKPSKKANISMTSSQFRKIEEVEAKDDDVDAHPKFESHPPLPVPALDVSANNSRQGTPRSRRSIEDAPINTDVMISYSHADKEIMQTIKETLIKNGLKVWVDVVGLAAGVNFLSKIGEAIIDSKTFITLLSENSIKSKYCQDELALAYISNKPIFPINISTKPSRELVPLMDTGMRLQLAGMKWTVIDETTDLQKKTTELLALLKDQMSELEAKSRTGAKSNERAGSASSERLKKATGRYRFYTRTISVDNTEENENPKHTENPNKFWERYFKDKLEIPWQAFIDALIQEHHEDLDGMYSAEDQSWLQSVLYREMEVEDMDGILDKTMFLNFCTIEDELLPLWKRVEDQARESYAMREVFNMKSSVRIQAIENLAKIKGPAVLDALRDLLDDPEPNVRAVATISLAKTGISDKLTIKKVLKILNDKDRLVREAGCIALGRLKAEAAVPRLVHIWRNDVISTVRNAAELALNQIAGPEVEKAMHITRILTEEIRMLTESADK